LFEKGFFYVFAGDMATLRFDCGGGHCYLQEFSLIQADEMTKIVAFVPFSTGVNSLSCSKRYVVRRQCLKGHSLHRQKQSPGYTGPD
jgi:hypothetical protein